MDAEVVKVTAVSVDELANRSKPFNPCNCRFRRCAAGDVVGLRLTVFGERFKPVGLNKGVGSSTQRASLSNCASDTSVLDFRSSISSVSLIPSIWLFRSDFTDSLSEDFTVNENADVRLRIGSISVDRADKSRASICALAFLRDWAGEMGLSFTRTASPSVIVEDDAVDFLKLLRVSDESSKDNISASNSLNV